MPPFVYRSTGGKIHFSLRTRGPQRIDDIAFWLRLPCRAVFDAVCRDDRIGWIGSPDADTPNVMVSLITKEAVSSSSRRRP